MTWCRGVEELLDLSVRWCSAGVVTGDEEEVEEEGERGEVGKRGGGRAGIER